MVHFETLFFQNHIHWLDNPFCVCIRFLIEHKFENKPLNCKPQLNGHKRSTDGTAVAWTLNVKERHWQSRISPSVTEIVVLEEKFCEKWHRLWISVLVDTWAYLQLEVKPQQPQPELTKVTQNIPIFSCFKYKKPVM